MSNISTPYYKALDFTLVFIACSAAYRLRFDTFSLPLYYFLPTAIFATLTTFSLSIAGFYQPINSNYSYTQTLSAAIGLITASVVTTACLYLTKTGEDYSRIWLVTSAIFSLVSLNAVRFLLSNVFKISSTQRVIVLVGQGHTPEFIVKRLNSSNVNGLLVAKHFKLSGGDLNLFREITNFIEQYRTDSKVQHPISEIWLTHSVFSVFDPEKLRHAFDNSAAKLVYIPELPESMLMREQEIQLLAGVPTINAEWSKRHKLGKLLKFIEDQIIAWIVLLLMWPIFIIIAVSIKLESSGPIIFKQVRYGLSGKEFLIWKFRTMKNTPASEKFKQAQKDDPRITEIGKILRKTSADELPQLINVIAGTMSIVGPRPHPTDLNEAYRGHIKNYMYRHTFKPGITGLAQIKGFRGETATTEEMEGRIKYDLDYVDNWSLMLDIKIILLTIVHLLFTDKAR